MLRSTILRYTTLFVIGAPGYYILELIWRGRSHPSMALCGGICLAAVGFLNEKLASRPLMLRAALGAVTITSVELAAGCLLNLALGLGVWDYSGMPLNLLGQICPTYTILWFLLCIPVCALDSALSRRIAVYRYRQ